MRASTSAYARIVATSTQFLGIALEIEELRPVRDVVHVLVPRLAQHERARDRRRRVVFGQHGAIGRRAGRRARERDAGMAVVVGTARANALEDERDRRRRGSPAHRSARPAQCRRRRRSAERRPIPRRTSTCPTVRARRGCRRGRSCTARACRRRVRRRSSARSTLPTFSSMKLTARSSRRARAARRRALSKCGRSRPRARSRRGTDAAGAPLRSYCLGIGSPRRAYAVIPLGRRDQRKVRRTRTTRTAPTGVACSRCAASCSQTCARAAISRS